MCPFDVMFQNIIVKKNKKNQKHKSQKVIFFNLMVGKGFLPGSGGMCL